MPCRQVWTTTQRLYERRYNYDRCGGYFHLTRGCRTRQGRIVLIILAKDTNQADEVREVLAWAGAESLDAAREHWWLGMRDAEAEVYREEAFRRGYARGYLYRQGMKEQLNS
jgi:hypothetical protein